MILLLHLMREQCHYLPGLAACLVVHAPLDESFPLKPRQRFFDALQHVNAVKGLWVQRLATGVYQEQGERLPPDSSRTSRLVSL